MPRSTTYARRKAARLCQDCGGKLYDTDRIRCAVCWYWTRKRESEPAALTRKQRRAASRRQAGLCLDCPAPVAPGRARCPGRRFGGSDLSQDAVDLTRARLLGAGANEEPHPERVVQLGQLELLGAPTTT